MYRLPSAPGTVPTQKGYHKGCYGNNKPAPAHDCNTCNKVKSCTINAATCVNHSEVRR